MSHFVVDIENPRQTSEKMETKKQENREGSDASQPDDVHGLVPYLKVDEIAVGKTLQNLRMFQTSMDDVDTQVAQIDKEQRRKYAVRSYREKKVT